jgi:cysteine desulfurase
MIYLDHAAATPMDPAVFAAMQPYFTEKFFNPSALYWPAQEVRKDIEAARASIAHWLGSRPSEITFTAGGTEANNLAIRGIMEQYPEGNIVVGSIEHESVLRTAHRYACKEAPVRPDGIVDVDALAGLIDNSTVLVSIMYANNEVGTVQPIRRISQLLDGIRKQRRVDGSHLPMYFHTDAAQAGAYLDLHASSLGVDMMTLNAGKIYGPKQCGLLYTSSHVRLQSQVTGGGQERGLRSGTENVAGVIGFAKALDLVQSRRHVEITRLSELQQELIRGLQKAIPSVVINGSLKNRLPNNVHLTIPGQDNERLLIALDEAGILCAAGSACSASNEEPSHVLRAMGLNDPDAQASLRITMGNGTTSEDIQTTVKKLTELLGHD